MKRKKIKEELKLLSNEELKIKLETLRRERLNLLMSSSTSHVKDYSQFKKLKINIARVLSYLQKKRKEV
ncbi:50S ribosomal protein L29 [Candidatus Dependentiae bacterium]|nr:MAG: 50S ribosomal protein L29 [Candidatus Dependentiae bacterium]